MLLARSINPSAPSFFRAKLSPYAKSSKGKVDGSRSYFTYLHQLFVNLYHVEVDFQTDTAIDTSPKKLEWTLTPELRIGIRFAETRLSDLICQNDCQALEFKGYGKVSICQATNLNGFKHFAELHHAAWIQPRCLCANGISSSVFWSLW
jgi:carnitine O-acetyltransferase